MLGTNLQPTRKRLNRYVTVNGLFYEIFDWYKLSRLDQSWQ